MLLTGCSFESHPVPPEGVPTIRLSTTPDPVPPRTEELVQLPRDGGRITFDENWEVSDGVWMMTDRGIPEIWRPELSSNGLLMDSDPHVLWVMSPGMYGAYPTRVVVYSEPPPVPRRCEDVVEAPLRVESGNPVVFDSDGPSRSLGLPRGDVRVRLCATGLDEAYGEPEFDGDDLDLHVSASRFRLQVWPATWRPGEIVKVGSTYARDEHARVAAAHTSS